MAWHPENENKYEAALADVRQAATDAVKIAVDLGQDTDRFVTSIFMELLMAKQDPSGNE